MTTSFSSLPIVDLSPLKRAGGTLLRSEDATKLSHQLYDVFATTGFAYLVNSPLSFSHEDVFSIGREFFGMPDSAKFEIAKKTFNPANANTYHGYFPAQPLSALDNLKEGFEQGPSKPLPPSSASEKINLAESNLWPDPAHFKSRHKLEQLYDELQTLSAQLLSLLALSLDKPAEYFNHYLTDSLSTLRMLHYPPNDSVAYQAGRSSSTLDSADSASITSADFNDVRLSCTPHTDSGILTLLHQDATGGLEVRNANGDWIPAPYIPGSIVVNIGDLMAEVSGGRFVATMHRVRAPPAELKIEGVSVEEGGPKFGRFSVPFFFEPGEKCVVRSVDDEGGHGILYGDHVRAKMKTWVEFQDDDEADDEE